MHRSLAGNARSATSVVHTDATLRPVLPFLAPCAFDASAPCPPSRRPRPAGPVSQRPASAPLQPLIRPVSHATHLRYADIYAFAQLRLAHTAADAGRGTTDAAKSRGRKRPQTKAGRPGGPDERLSRSAPLSIIRVPTLRVRRVGSEPVGTRRIGRTGASLLNLRRRRQLEKERHRLETFLAHREPSHALAEQGRYRSLQRRLHALTRTGEALVDLTPPSDAEGVARFDSIAAFAALDRRIYPGMARKSHGQRLRHDPRVENLALKLSAGVDALGWRHLAQAWSKVPPADRDTRWHLLLLYYLGERPEHALHFLRSLTAYNAPAVITLRRDMLADAFELIARRAAKSLKTGHTDVAPHTDLVPAFMGLYRRHLARSHRICSQDLLLNLSRVASPEDLPKLFDLLVQTKAYMDYPTLLHYAHAFSSFGDHANAVRCLQHFIALQKAPGANTKMMNLKKTRWTCAKILRSTMKDRQNYHATTDIVAEFAALGVKLDILLYNVIMHNAVDARDYDTAFRVYDLLRQNGIKTDNYTYPILLHGCAKADEPGEFAAFAEECAQRAVEARDPLLATNYLYWLYMQHKNKERSKLPAILLHAYVRFFDLAPLKPFLDAKTFARFSKDVGADNDNGSVRMPPLPVAIYIMLQSLLRQALVHELHANELVWNLYVRFREVVERRTDPLITQLARSPIVWNAFLLAFCRQQQFASASGLVKYMSVASASSSSTSTSASASASAANASAASVSSAVSTSSTPSTPTIPPPNVYTYNIFMHAFFRTAQPRAAERIFDIMRRTGVTPDQFTYEVLLHGYAREQQVDKVGEIMARLDEMDGERELDNRVLTALGRIVDRKGLVGALERGRVGREGEGMRE